MTMTMTMKTKPNRRRITFSVVAAPGSTVCLAGSFNNWDGTKKKLADKKTPGNYTGTLLLDPGEYQYKFVIDGIWCVDPVNDDFVLNEFGSLNSVIHVA